MWVFAERWRNRLFCCETQNKQLRRFFQPFSDWSLALSTSHPSTPSSSSCKPQIEFWGPKICSELSLGIIEASKIGWCMPVPMLHTVVWHINHGTYKEVYAFAILGGHEHSSRALQRAIPGLCIQCACCDVLSWPLADDDALHELISCRRIHSGVSSVNATLPQHQFCPQMPAKLTPAGPPWPLQTSCCTVTMALWLT